MPASSSFDAGARCAEMRRCDVSMCCMYAQPLEYSNAGWTAAAAADRSVAKAAIFIMASAASGTEGSRKVSAMTSR